MASRPAPDRTQLLVGTRPSTPAPTVVVTLAGEIDADNSPEVQRIVEGVLERQQPNRVCLDLQQVTFLDSAGIRALLICRRRALRLRCVLQISRAHPGVRQVLAITCLLETFHLPDAGPTGP